jgi:O-antigen/teichoic acid export membrane protein
VLNAGSLKYLKNTLWIFLEQFIKVFAIFVVNIFIARYLGPEQFGLLSFSIGVVAIALAISRLGMESVLIRELIENVDNASTYVGTAFLLMTLTGIFCTVILFLSLHLMNIDAELAQYISLLSLSLIPQAFLVLDYHFQSQTRAKYSSLAKSLALVISGLIKLLIIYLQQSLFILIIAIVFESVLISMFLLIIYNKKQSKSFRFILGKEIAIKLLKSSYPMLLAALTTVLYMRIDQFMIKAFLGDYELGVYSAISKLYELWVMVTVVLCTSLLPAIVRLKDKSIAEYERGMILLFRGVIVVSTLVSIFSSFFADTLILLLFGEQFISGTVSFIILMWSSIFAAMGSVTVRYLTVEKLEKKVALRAVIALTFNVFLNALFIPLLGLHGAAISTLCSLIIANYLIDFIDKDLKKLWRLKNRSVFGFNVTNAG